MAGECNMSEPFFSQLVADYLPFFVVKNIYTYVYTHFKWDVIPFFISCLQIDALYQGVVVGFCSALLAILFAFEFLFCKSESRLLADGMLSMLVFVPLDLVMV